MIQRALLTELEEQKQSDGTNQYYYMDVDQYYSMCIYIAKHFHISPKEIYETWALPMMIVTYAEVHNSAINEYVTEQEYLNSKVKRVIDAKNEYIRNITVEMIEEMASEHKESKESNAFDEAHKALLEMYGGQDNGKSSK